MVEQIKKIGFFVFVIVLFVTSFNSCKQCFKPAVVAEEKHDTVVVPTIATVTAEIKKDSLNPFLYYKRAQAYEANNDFKSAETDMFLALTLDSLRPDFYLYAANLFKKTGDLRRGIALMDKAIATDSMNINYYVKAAELSYIDTTIKGNYIVALNHLNAAILKNPQNADIYFFKGNVFKALGDTAKAISAFQTATDLNPKYYDAYVQIGVLLAQKRDQKNAEKYLDNAIRVSDKPEDALYNKANILKEEGRELQKANNDAAADEKFKAAIENFKKVVELDHRKTEAFMGLGFSYYQMDSVEQAYKFYGMAAETDPGYAGAYFSKGLCAEDLNRTREAMSLYQTAIDLDPHLTLAQQHLNKLKAAIHP
jgi:tetratricopeptide (TPR) repeat protein